MTDKEPDDLILNEVVAQADGRPGCPVTVWDGPYSYRCSCGTNRCHQHGPFATQLAAARKAQHQHPQPQDGDT